MRALAHHAGAARLFAAASMLVCVPVGSLRAQLGSGWVPTNHTKRIHLDDVEGLQTFSWTASKSVCSPTSCADYGYNAATDTETFRIFDSRSNRSEIRLQNEYSTGIRQFEGYVTFFEPLHDESLFQIFGNSGDAATFLMMRGYRDNGGTIRVMGGSHTIASGVYGQEVRINVIHEQNVSAKFYVNGRFVHEKPDNDTAATNYWKYGVYGTTNGNVPAVAQWRAVRTFRDGLPPGNLPTPLGAYEAEEALLRGPVVAANQVGFTGTGFVDYVNATSDYIQWSVNTPDVGLYDLKFRYALQSGDRPLQVLVNGQLVDSALSFPATGAWSTWADVTIPSQLLAAGANTIRATAIGSSGPNIDYLMLSTMATGSRVFGDYNNDGTVDAADFVVWRKSVGEQGSNLPADGSGLAGIPDGIVDHHDYVHWRANFGRSLSGATGASLAAAAVPEPCSASLILLASAAIAGRTSRWTRLA